MTAVWLIGGMLLPESITHTEWFAVLCVFVAVNTVLYLTLAIVKLLPKAYLSEWVDQRNRRAEPEASIPLWKIDQRGDEMACSRFTHRGDDVGVQVGTAPGSDGRGSRRCASAVGSASRH